MALRFTTAGESHGPGLTAVVEGLPAGLELHPGRHRPRPRAAPARPRPRRADEDRDATAPRSPPGVRHGRTLGSPVALLIENRDYANWAERMTRGRSRRRSRRCTCRGPGHADLAGRPEVRLHRRAQRARAGERARDGGARGRRRAREGLPARARHDGLQPRAPDRLGARRRRPATRRRTTSRRRRVAGALPRRRGRAPRWSAEIDHARKANETLGGVFEVRGVRARPGPRLAHLLGRAPRRAAGAGDHVDPGDEGRRDRRRLRPGRAGRLAGARRDLLDRGARLLPRDQPRRRDRGRHDDRRRRWSCAAR